jgi:hypothetical protein
MDDREISQRIDEGDGGVRPPYVRVSAALKAIASCLRSKGEEMWARDIECLSGFALSIDPEYQAFFLSKITRGSCKTWATLPASLECS